MLIFIPLCSVFYALLREGVNSRLQRKRERAEKTEDKSENGETREARSRTGDERQRLLILPGTCT